MQPDLRSMIFYRNRSLHKFGNTAFKSSEFPLVVVFTGDGTENLYGICQVQQKIGCGMDSDEKYRNYPGIAVLV
jgi:hypothetical protein